MHSIKTLNKIAKCGLDELPADRFQVSDTESDPDAILVRSFVIEESALTDNLKCIGRAGAGVNNIPVEECARRGIVVFNTPGANANAVKELVISSLFLSSRRIHAGINWSQSLIGKPDVAALVEKGKSDFTGPEIFGKTLGIIGLGAIGGLVSNAAVALGMKVVGFDPFLSQEASARLSPQVQIVDSEDAVAAASDYITIHTPMNAKTKGKFNAEFFAKCKKGVRLLNFSRGELFNNTDLLAALESGAIGCYVTDFPTEELLANDKIIPIPHLGASTPESEDNCATMAAAQIREFLICGNIKNSVNFPDLVLPKGKGERLCVLHKNSDGFFSAVVSMIEQSNSSGANSQSASKGDWGYTIIDLPPAGNGKALSELFFGHPSVISVRRLG